MNYEEIVKFIEENPMQNFKEVFKAVISYEVDVTNERSLDNVVDYFYQNTDYLTTILDEDIYYKAVRERNADMYKGYRTCNHPKCHREFDFGILMESNSEVYCSEECAEDVYPDILEEDYGTDIICWTEFEPYE